MSTTVGHTPVRIVLTGSECTGKSTLAKALADHYGVGFVPEYLREYFEQAGGTLTIEDAVPIAKGQLAGENVLEKCGTSPLICDTNALSSVVYSRYYYGACPAWIEEILEQRTYHHYLLCHIDVPWQADGQRDRPELREDMQTMFEKELQRRSLPYTPLSSSHEQRLAKAIAIIDRLLNA